MGFSQVIFKVHCFGVFKESLANLLQRPAGIVIAAHNGVEVLYSLCFIVFEYLIGCFLFSTGEKYHGRSKQDE
jgi:hypothetical protein